MLQKYFAFFSKKCLQKTCKELDIPRSNFNRYCRNEFQRLDAQLICKLCSYLDCGIEELIEYVKE
ncbi:helix-turn-helix domain-containing protein [[Clostridium] scindens]|uniref:helix-turn-helix domain-containing protein n=1 Tax=Clostridium scindens (strain JCM 10418 / VPI 12708) TaxID=29347 RepID=UPI001E464356|nr:helix-turn-helix transcriptional regulator [[Clostridium] scindens]